MVILLFVASAYGADVKFKDNASKNTPESIGISMASVAEYEVVKYKHDKTAVNNRVKQVMEANPVTSRERTKKIVESEQEDKAIYERGSVYFEVSKVSGAEILMDLDQYTVQSNKLPEASEQNMEKSAKDYIKDHVPGVRMNEISMGKIKKIMNGTAKTEEGKEPTEIKTEVANYVLIFERKKDKISFVGPGDKIRVYFSSDGQVIGHSKIWRDYKSEPKAKKKIKTTKEIQEKFKAKHGQTKASNIEVDFLTFGYLSQGRNKRQDTASPVYILGYKTNEYSKRTLEFYDAYTGNEILMTEPAIQGDVRARP
jgi:hypothetical protein